MPASAAGRRRSARRGSARGAGPPYRRPRSRRRRPRRPSPRSRRRCARSTPRASRPSSPAPWPSRVISARSTTVSSPSSSSRNLTEFVPTSMTPYAAHRLLSVRGTLTFGRPSSPSSRTAASTAAGSSDSTATVTADARRRSELRPLRHRVADGEALAPLVHLDRAHAGERAQLVKRRRPPGDAERAHDLIHRRRRRAETRPSPRDATAGARPRRARAP